MEETREKDENVDHDTESANNPVKKLCGRICQKKVLVAVSLGQILSLFICGTAVTSGLLQQHNIFIPTAQSFLNYLLLGLIYATWLSCRRGDQNILPILRARGWKYFLLALVDVEANYLIVKAYHYTTVTSVQLLDCFTIPTVLALSWLFLQVRYRCLHITGVIICLLGVSLLIVTDVLVQKNPDEGSNKLLGDMLCIAGATCYGISNVCQEYAVRSFDRVEFLGMVGFFGSLINGLQLALLERQEVSTAVVRSLHEVGVLLPLLGFSVSLFALYSLMPIVIEKTSATAVNLNLLSADFYALLLGLFLFHYQFHILYFGAFVLIMCGVFVYSLRSPPVAPIPENYREILEDAEAQQEPTLNESYNSGTSSSTTKADGIFPKGVLPTVQYTVRKQLCDRNSATEDERQLMLSEENKVESDVAQNYSPKKTSDVER